MLDLERELEQLLKRFEEKKISYALCGGLAMCVHGHVRTTIDIDILALTDELPVVLDLARELGFDMPAAPMSFARGKIQIHRVTKIDPEAGDYIPLDILLVTDPLRSVWETREKRIWNDITIWTASSQGLIAMKSIRGSGIDQDDIARLQGKI